MKKRTRNIVSVLIVSLFCLCTLSPSRLWSQTNAASAEKQSVSLSLFHVKLGNGDHQIKATLSSMGDAGRVFLKEMKVTFMGGENQDVHFGESVTNDKGIASFTVPKDKLPPKDSAGTFTYGAAFDGNDKYESISDNVIVKDLIIEVTATEEDSVKTVTAKVYELNEKGEQIPVTGTDLFFYVPRMFSYMKVGEGTLDSTGMVSAEFPSTLPADSTGNLDIIARIEDHEVYGNVEGSTTVKWGVPTQLIVKGSYRALWSQVAPTWMVITLIILLLGVWGHYAYAVVQIIRIKKEARKLQD